MFFSGTQVYPVLFEVKVDSYISLFGKIVNVLKLSVCSINNNASLQYCRQMQQFIG